VRPEDYSVAFLHVGLDFVELSRSKLGHPPYWLLLGSHLVLEEEVVELLGYRNMTFVAFEHAD